MFVKGATGCAVWFYQNKLYQNTCSLLQQCQDMGQNYFPYQFHWFYCSQQLHTQKNRYYSFQNFLHVIYTKPLGPVPERIRSWDPNWPIAFHKCRSWAPENTKPSRLWLMEWCCKHWLGSIEMKLRDPDCIEDARLTIRIHDVTMEGVGTSFMRVDSRASRPVQCTHTVLSIILRGLDMPC